MTKHDLVIRGGTVVDGTGAERAHGRRRHRRRHHQRSRRRRWRRGARHRRRRVARHARIRRHPLSLRRSGHLRIRGSHPRRGTASPPSLSATVASASHRSTTLITSDSSNSWKVSKTSRGPYCTKASSGRGARSPSSWNSVDGRSFDIDVALQVPHGALRLHVMGERGAAGARPRLPTTSGKVAKLAAAGIEAGALGFTTSRTMNHRTSRGRVHADTHGRSRRADRHRRSDRRDRPGRLAGRVRLRRRRRGVRDLPAHGGSVGPAAVVLARADAERQLATSARVVRASERRRRAHDRSDRTASRRPAPRTAVHAQPAARQPGVPRDIGPTGRRTGPCDCGSRVPGVASTRLRRIHEVSGYSPTDPRDAYALRLAVTLGRLFARAKPEEVS